MRNSSIQCGGRGEKKIAEEHINSFPVIESHYCRDDSMKLYLDSSLNLSKMYRMFLDFCTQKGLASVKKSIYEKIFNENFNLSFFK